MKILIADDESEIRKVVRLLLEEHGYEVIEAQDGSSAVSAATESTDIDLIIMDIMMPAVNGIEATRLIRDFSTVPILFLTAKSLARDKTAAYDVGGDDYLIKPFSPSELLLKIRALTRRYTVYSKAEERPELVSLASGVILNPKEREVTKNGDRVEGLREREMDMLIYLAKNRGRAINPSELYEAVWGERALASASNTVTVHMLNLRRKLEDTPSSPKLIRTVWGKGYQID
ncbi:MAG: response regulator transcription factor [Clostridia bacterium]|nr:response regulator transcription factor [Clostridia bacterium]